MESEVLKVLNVAFDKTFQSYAALDIFLSQGGTQHWNLVGRKEITQQIPGLPRVELKELTNDRKVNEFLPNAGDLLIFSGNNGPSQFIRYLTNSPYSHIAIFVEIEGQIVVLEAHAKGVTVIPWNNDYLSVGHFFDIYLVEF